MASQNTALQESAAQFQNQADWLTTESAVLQRQYEQAVAALQSQILALRQECELLQKELSDTLRERNALLGSQEKLSRQIDDLGQSKATLEGENTTFRGEVEQLVSQNTTLQDRIIQFQHQVETLSAENVGLEQQLAQTVTAFQPQIEASQRRYEELVESADRQGKELQANIETERNRALRLEKRVETLERQSQIVSEEAARLNVQIAQMQAALQTPLGKGFTTLLRLTGGPDLSL